jgi:hypothetical protein
MNYLQICQRVHDIAGFQGQFNTVQTSGYQAVITTSVKDAYEDVQRYRPEWNYLKTHRDINVSDASDEYLLTDLWTLGETPDLAAYRHINWYDPATDRAFRLIEVPYDNFILMKFPEPHQPRLYSVRPWDKALLISPVDQVYTLDLHYTKALHQLVNNTDEPLVPVRHRQIIIYGALMKISTYTGNPTLFDTYSIKYAESMGQLMREENPARRVTKRPVV